MRFLMRGIAFTGQFPNTVFGSCNVFGHGTVVPVMTAGKGSSGFNDTVAACTDFVAGVTVIFTVCFFHVFEDCFGMSAGRI